MAEPLSFETITDAKKGAELIHKYIRRQRVEFPDDLADLISEIAAELLCSVDACHSADFLLREQDKKKEAAAAMQGVMNAITTFKNQLGFLTSQADYCIHGINGTRLADDQYQHKPNNRLPLLPASTIASGLAGVKSDFRSWRVERRTGGWVLIVETHPIKIEDPRYDVVVDFGPFNIELLLSQLARGVRKPYYVIALEPNTAEGHVHPHVRSKMLCEGQGINMIEKALKVGDIQSFLIIVSQILSTYNPSSPYMRLEYWSKQLPRGPNPRPHAGFGEDRSTGTACAICEEETDDPHNCSLCDNRICEDCSGYCESRSITVCHRCRERMRAERTSCPNCRNHGQSGCLVEERQICADCEEGYRPSDMIRCGHQNRYMCRGCFDNRANGQRTCCADWENAQNCPMASHLPRSETGFANTISGNTTATPEDANALNQAMRRQRSQTAGRDDVTEEQPSVPRNGDDGVGGFGPPQTGNTGEPWTPGPVRATGPDL